MVEVKTIVKIIPSSLGRKYKRRLQVESADNTDATLFLFSYSCLSKDDGYGNDNATKHEYYWLKNRKNTRAARATRISVHVFAQPYSTKQQRESFDDNDCGRIRELTLE